MCKISWSLLKPFSRYFTWSCRKQRFFRQFFFHYNFRSEVDSDDISSVAADHVGVNVHVQFGDSRSNGSRDIRGTDFVLNERANMTEGYHIRQKREMRPLNAFRHQLFWPPNVSWAVQHVTCLVQQTNHHTTNSMNFLKPDKQMVKPAGSDCDWLITCRWLALNFLPQEPHLIARYQLCVKK